MCPPSTGQPRTSRTTSGASSTPRLRSVTPGPKHQQQQQQQRRFCTKTVEAKEAFAHQDSSRSERGVCKPATTTTQQRLLHTQTAVPAKEAFAQHHQRRRLRNITERGVCTALPKEAFAHHYRKRHPHSIARGGVCTTSPKEAFDQDERRVHCSGSRPSEEVEEKRWTSS